MNRYDNVPDILKQQSQWVVWGVPGEFPKAPFNPHSLLKLKTVPAKSGIAETWGTFGDAEKCVKQGLARGIGYEFAGQGIYGVDLDGVLIDGIISTKADEIVKELASFTEISPSGKGLHIFVTADNLNLTRHRKQGGFVEIYGNARYFTVTGNIFGGYDRIAYNPCKLQWLHDQYLLPEQLKAAAPICSVESARSAPDYLRRGLQKDLVLLACWYGEHRRGDESASDLALLNKLAYWCNGNPGAMTAAFLRSPYYSQKDEAHQKKCSRADYLPNTIKTACAALRSTAHEDIVRYRQARYKDEAR